ncbi:hypothetical protein D3C72_2209970 [compost metagenome]
MTQQRLTLCPAFDAFKQRPGLVPAGLARGLGGIEMNMRLNKRRDRQPATGVEDLVAFVMRVAHRGYLSKSAILNANLP